MAEAIDQTASDVHTLRQVAAREMAAYRERRGDYKITVKSVGQPVYVWKDDLKEDEANELAKELRSSEMFEERTRIKVVKPRFALRR